MRINRRDFLLGVAGASGAALLGRTARSAGAELGTQGLGSLPPPGESGIEHIVVVMMENRSFDHFLGWLPNADGRQAGLSYLDGAGTAHSTHPLAPDFTGCSHPDPDHSYAGGRVQYDGGAMDGFLRSGANDEYAIGFYVEEDRPFGSALARHFTTLDRSFCSILGPTFPNRFFLHSAQTDRLSNTLVLSTLPTIWDRLAAAEVSSLYYFSNLPFLALWGARYIPISRPYLQFLADAAAGTLPAVSFIDPRFTDFTPDNSGNDDHPPADIRAGDAFLSQTFHALASGPGWSHTVLIVTYDEWGGFFDHVPPPRAAAPNGVDPDLVNGKALLGFRVPTIVASPFTRGEPDDPKVKGMTFDHTSILKLIEWRFGLDPLTARDASRDVENLARALKFKHPDATVPILPAPEPPPPAPCVSTTVAASRARSAGAAPDDPTDSRNPWPRLRDSGLLAGWELPD
ncbi:MAG TPA: alkaline phosphatase family protein [Vicinamibacteria bacterium]